jgi:hypothetical protein
VLVVLRVQLGKLAQQEMEQAVMIQYFLPLHLLVAAAAVRAG